MASVLLVIGVVIAFVGAITFLGAAFNQNILWGLACLFLPIVQIVFLLLHWDKAKKGFFIYLWSMPFLFLAHLLRH